MGFLDGDSHLVLTDSEWGFVREYSLPLTSLKHRITVETQICHLSDVNTFST